MRKQKEVIIRSLREVSEYEEELKLPETSLKDLIRRICKAGDWTIKEVHTKFRTDKLVFIRGIIDLIANSNGHTMRNIAKEMDRDHSSVINSLSSIEDRLDTDKNVRRFLGEIMQALKEDFELNPIGKGGE